MSHFMEQDLMPDGFSNVYYDTFREVVELYPNLGVRIEIDGDKGIIKFYDTGGDIGSFDHSDICIYYDWDTYRPYHITETIHRRYYNLRNWIKTRSYVRCLTAQISEEFGYKLKCVVKWNKIQLIHYLREL